jgi:hypothetical protein
MILDLIGCTTLEYFMILIFFKVISMECTTIAEEMHREAILQQSSTLQHIGRGGLFFTHTVTVVMTSQARLSRITCMAAAPYHLLRSTASFRCCQILSLRHYRHTLPILTRDRVGTSHRRFECFFKKVRMIQPSLFISLCLNSSSFQ